MSIPRIRRRNPYLHRRNVDSDRLPQLAFPLGGIGAGSISFSAGGGLQDFAIRNKPNLTALPDGHNYTDSAFALLHLRGEKPITRLVEGPMPMERVYNQGLMGQGYRKGGHEGFPRFDRAEFSSRFPFATTRLSDDEMPLQVNVTAWSPFIPGDDHSSSLPVAVLEYEIRNPSRETADFTLSFHMSHLAAGRHHNMIASRNRQIDDWGVYLWNNDPPNSETYASAALFALEGAPRIKAMWYRGGWFDCLTEVWREVSTDAFTENEGNDTEDIGGPNGCSLLFEGSLAPGAVARYSVGIAWHYPNIHYRHGGEPLPKPETPPTDPPPAWQPYYVAPFADAETVARYMRGEHLRLQSESAAFRDSLYDSDLPDAVLDAIGSNLAILKSPTVLRQENGNLWAWEGCFTTQGCCHGSCTHVWNYEQAIPHLFPALERSLRDQELLNSMDDAGHVNFRSALPDGPTPHTFHAASDGQLGGILKVYREWRISGDTEWLRTRYSRAKRSLDWGIRHWDPERQGLLTATHHNTYDIEFIGPDGMCASIYIAALSAMASMAEGLGRTEDATNYRELAERGAANYASLFNGEYLIQKPENPEAKYQYGEGCLADGVIGAWMARLYGVSTPLDPELIRSHLQAIFRHNFRADLRRHVCRQRPGYATGREAGLLLCTWPRGGDERFPFPYSDEVWTGIEYQVASHCLMEGLVDEGLAIVEGARSRYDGAVRNPFNEYECGNFYARALASYSLLQSYSGFRYDAVSHHLELAPVTSKRPFQTFFATESGFGTLQLTRSQLRVELVRGTLALRSIVVDGVTVQALFEESEVVTAGARREWRLG